MSDRSACPHCGGSGGLEFTVHESHRWWMGWEGDEGESETGVVLASRSSKVGRCVDCKRRVRVPNPWDVTYMPPD